jgi:hypothetical protein
VFVFETTLLLDTIALAFCGVAIFFGAVVELILWWLVLDTFGEVVRRQGSGD